MKYAFAGAVEELRTSNSSISTTGLQIMAGQQTMSSQERPFVLSRQTFAGLFGGTREEDTRKNTGLKTKSIFTFNFRFLLVRNK